ncbi:MAG: di-trans,poly-cis-decaprenylcistransferase [Pseudomonadota bacterium]
MQSEINDAGTDRGNSLHVAVIMDGNGRWAKARGLPRTAGHHAGVGALRLATEAAAKQGIKTLTVYAFSVDNWQRPEPEVTAIMGLLRHYLSHELSRLVETGIRLSVIGRRDRLDPKIRAAIQHAEHVTRDGRTLHLRVAIDYSARDAILAAINASNGQHISRGCLSKMIAADCATPDVDLLIRTSGEQRLSDFLLWECAYAELYFTETLWPDFDADDLANALDAYHRRDRRFGSLSPSGKAA